MGLYPQTERLQVSDARWRLTFNAASMYSISSFRGAWSHFRMEGRGSLEDVVTLFDDSLNWFRTRQSPRKAVNLFLLSVIVKDQLTDLWGNWLLRNGLTWGCRCSQRQLSRLASAPEKPYHEINRWFLKVKSPIKPSTYCLQLLIKTISWRVCGVVHFLKCLINQWCEIRVIENANLGGRLRWTRHAKQCTIEGLQNRWKI